MCVCICIYIERERGREKERENERESNIYREKVSDKQTDRQSCFYCIERQTILEIMYERERQTDKQIALTHI